MAKPSVSIFITVCIHMYMCEYCVSNMLWLLVNHQSLCIPAKVFFMKRNDFTVMWFIVLLERSIYIYITLLMSAVNSCGYYKYQVEVVARFLYQNCT